MPRIEMIIDGEVKGLARPKLSTVNGRARAYDPISNVVEKGRLQFFLKKTLLDLGLEGHEKADGRGYSIVVGAYFHCPNSWSNKAKAAALADEFRPTKKPDMDNILKLIGDAFNGILWDDASVTSTYGYKRYAEKDYLRIVIRWEEPK